MKNYAPFTTGPVLPEIPVSQEGAFDLRLFHILLVTVIAVVLFCSCGIRCMVKVCLCVKNTGLDKQCDFDCQQAETTCQCCQF